jgi:hypothetical protein
MCDAASPKHPAHGVQGTGPPALASGREPVRGVVAMMGDYEVLRGTRFGADG